MRHNGDMATSMEIANNKTECLELQKDPAYEGVNAKKQKGQKNNKTCEIYHNSQHKIHQAKCYIGSVTDLR